MDDLHLLSRLYIALVQRGYRTEVTDAVEAASQRIKKWKPVLLITGSAEFHQMKQGLNLPVIVLSENDADEWQSNDGVLVVNKNIPLGELMKQVKKRSV